jgi:hypothetical protein
MQHEYGRAWWWFASSYAVPISRQKQSSAEVVDAVRVPVLKIGGTTNSSVWEASRSRPATRPYVVAPPRADQSRKIETVPTARGLVNIVCSSRHTSLPTGVSVTVEGAITADQNASSADRRRLL